ncbi:hypothetical protein NGRA_1603 [Nosema granulosis]|uniref:Uncharacterized protein n=1 Tax=Nosema granulosis TaxID=83296 RepID=A0A9P6KYG8_9MICR|nr:hypothetical protein NGRA_1603 [Nosema granulosis]
MGVLDPISSSDNRRCRTGYSNINDESKEAIRVRQKRWRDVIEDATLAINLSFNRALGTSPFVYTQGRLPEFEVDRKLGQQRVYVSKNLSEKTRKESFVKYKQEISKVKVDNKKNTI